MSPDASRPRYPTVALKRMSSVACGVTIAAALAVGTAPVLAGNWIGYDAGDKLVFFDLCNLEANTHTAWHNNNDHDITPTDIVSQHAHDCFPAYDVVANDLAFGLDDPTGWYECHNVVGSDCRDGHVHLNTSYSNIPEDFNRTLTLVCEEIGHSVGLWHSGSSASCMSSNSAALHLDAHDKAMIDALY